MSSRTREFITETLYTLTVTGLTILFLMGAVAIIGGPS